VRQRVDPANPKSAKQMGVRAMMAFLGHAWAALGAPAKATWAEGALAKAIAPFHQFVSVNLSRWQNFQAPTQDYPAAETSTGNTVTTQTCTGGLGQVNITLAWTTNADDWGVAILRDTAEITAPDWTKVIAVVPPTSAGALTYIDTPLAAGTYHYRTVILNNDGKLGTVKADSTGVVT
jgi:hypothetical protein